METKIAHDARPEFLEGSNKIGVLVIHGFTGSTQSMRDVAYKLHEQGYTINMPCLKGHGTTPEDMETTGYKDWIQSVEDAYNEIRPKVEKLFLLGLSMGGTLSLYNAINKNLDGVISVNGSVDIPDFKRISENPETPRFFAGIGSDVKKPGVIEWAYDKIPKKSTKEIVLLNKLVKDDLDKIHCPILIFKSPEDHVVASYNQDYIFANVSSTQKELIVLNESYHVATLDNDWETIVEKSISFIEDICK